MYRIILAFCALASLAGAQSSVFQILDNPIPVPSRVEAAGDVDGDGDQDLLIPDGVLINDGHGRFSKVALAALTFARAGARLVDINGDGLADLISFIPTVGPTAAHLRIDFNTGMTFVLGALLMPFPFTAIAVGGFAVGDVDGDGDKDILAGTNSGGAAPASAAPVLWLNNGLGLFAQSPASVPGSPLPSSVVLLSDLDADGDLDAVFAATSGPAPTSVQAAFNTGGVFTPAPAPIWPNAVSSIATAHLNNDALPDLILCSGSSVAVLLSSPSGFLAPVLSSVLPSNGPAFHAPVDVNGDGIDELLQWTPAPRNLALRPITPGGQLGAPLQSWTDLGLQPIGDYETLNRDLDGDGDRDFIALSDRESIALMNDGAGTLVRTGGRVVNVAITTNQNVGDVDGDGDVDVLGLDPVSSLVAGYNDGDGFLTGTPLSLPPPAYYYRYRTFDRDGDGDLDIYATLDTGGGLFAGPDLVFDNSGGTFTQAGSVTGANDGRLLRSADFDGDGDQDLVIARWVVGVPPAFPLAFIRNLGAGGLAGAVSVGTNHWTFDLDLADFDGNGTIDVFQTNSQPSPAFPVDPCVVYLNSGNGTFVPVVQTGVIGRFTAVGDLNGDAMPDLVIDGHVRFNTGGGNFVAGPLLSALLMGPASLVDVDLDGDLDLVETPGTVMFNAGGGVFGPPQSYLPRQPALTFATQIPESAVVDLDHDGDPDIVTPGPAVFMNTTRQIARGSIPRPGRPASIDLYGSPGAGWFLFASNATTSFPFPPLGTVLIDPASAQLGAMGTFAGPTAPLPGTASLAALVPNNPALVGWTTWWQALDAAQVRLTNRIKITVLTF